MLGQGLRIHTQQACLPSSPPLCSRGAPLPFTEFPFLQEEGGPASAGALSVASGELLRGTQAEMPHGLASSPPPPLTVSPGFSFRRPSCHVEEMYKGCKATHTRRSPQLPRFEVRPPATKCHMLNKYNNVIGFLGMS